MAFQRISERSLTSSLFVSLRGLHRSELPLELLAGVTLLAIAVPEQLATSQLAGTPAYLALLAFIAGTVVFAMVGSNPIVSVGADSTIAPLFAAALIRLSATGSSHYLTDVSATAVVTGVIVLAIGVLRLGWLADFLSVPIIAGFMTGIGLVIMVHQLPHALGLASVEGTFAHRIATIATHLSSVHGWTIALFAGTFALVFVGEKLSPKFPFALAAVIITTVITKAAHLTNHGVATLGTFAVTGPTWRLAGFSWHDATTVATTSVTVAIVVLSQTAATSRSSADDLGVGVRINRDFLGVGLANVVSGVVGSMPVNASPARTGVTRVAGGRTQVVGLLAAAGVIALSPVASLLSAMPLATLAGVLFFVASRLVKIATLRQIARVNRWELALALATAIVVMFVGVQQGIGMAVLLAIVDRTRRSSRPHATVLGRVPGTTSWGALGVQGAAVIDHVTVVLFDAPLYFANAATFRDQMHAIATKYPATTCIVLDAAAIHDVDFTGLQTLNELLTDLARDKVSVVLARPNPGVVATLHESPSPLVRSLRTYDTVDEAVESLTTASPGGAERS